MHSQERIQRIRQLLIKTLEAKHVEIIDKSALHAGHQQAAGGGHFQLKVVSERFHGLLPLAAHRLVYGALEEMMAEEIHALELETLTPEQWDRA